MSAALSFWWKPGCATNTKQIRLLQQAGCQVEVRDLLSEPWTAARLAGFFGEKPVAEWFNPAAPAVKSGQLVPASFTAEAAIQRMLAEPLLIRRPLLQLGEDCRSGFDPAWLAERGVVLPLEAGQAAPEGCSHGHAHEAHAACAPPR